MTPDVLSIKDFFLTQMLLIFFSFLYFVCLFVSFF